MNQTLSDILQWIAASLLVPDIVLLLTLLGMTILWVGGFLAEWVERLRHRPAFAQQVHRLKRDAAAVDDLAAFSPRFGLPRRAFRELQHTTHRDKLLDDLHLAAQRSLRTLHLGIRLGPMLGLIGTLIPLGPALQGMSGGNIQHLADHLMIAFACPVLGIGVGGVCFLLHAFRQHWYQQDLGDLEFVLDCLTHVAAAPPHLADTEAPIKLAAR